MGLEEESKRSLAMEAELERHLVQINSQSEELQKYRINTKDLEDALRKARADAEHFKKQLSEAHRYAFYILVMLLPIRILGYAIG